MTALKVVFQWVLEWAVMKLYRLAKNYYKKKKAQHESKKRAKANAEKLKRAENALDKRDALDDISNDFSD